MAKKKASKKSAKKATKQAPKKATKKRAAKGGKKKGGKKKGGKKRAAKKSTELRQAGVEKMLATNAKKARKGKKRAKKKEPESDSGKAASRGVGHRQALAKQAEEIKKAAIAAAKNNDVAAMEKVKAAANNNKTKVKAAAKNGDLSRVEEQALLRKLDACQKHLKNETGAWKSGKKSSKKKGAKKAAKKKGAKKASKKKGAKKASKKSSSGSMDYDDYRHNVRVPAGVVGSRKKAAERKKVCNTKRKKKPVGCQPRPSESSLAACTRATASWEDRSDNPRTARQVCGPGAPSLKKAAAIGGIEKAAKAAGKLSPKQAEIMRKFRNLKK